MTKTNLPKAQHYVPRFILNNFCIGDTSQVFVFDKRHESVFKTNIRNVAVEKDFYNLEIDGVTASIEPNLSKLESLAADIVHKIVEDGSLKNLSDDEKHLFSYFIVTQLIRKMFKNNIDFKKPPRMQKN